MLTKKQLKIFNVFQRNIFKEYTYKEVKKLAEEKSNSVIQNSIKAFLKENLIKERAIGTSKLYLVNSDNEKSYLYFEAYNKESLPKLVLKTIKELKDELDNHTFFYSIAIFGSHAIGKQTKSSDLDIAVIIEQEDKRKIIEAVFKTIELRTILEVHGHAISKNEFLEMLAVDYENLGKEIARKHLIIHNPDIFYSILKEGVKHGFKL